jgi:exportin-2 (importin alpha re-exporter)
LDFFTNYIAQDLTNADINPMLKVDAIKFVHIFRNQVVPHHSETLFPLLIHQLASENYIIYSYAAIAVERILTLTDDSKQPLIPRSFVTQHAQELLRHLFKLITKDTKAEKIQENEWLMKCVMRVLITIKEGVVPFADMVLTNFINITNVIRHNPSNPRFYYYHFEGIGALIRYVAPVEAEKLEDRIFQGLTPSLSGGVQEFMPYIFQLFSALLESNPSKDLSANYRTLLSPLLSPTLWETKGNIPALVRLMSSIIRRSPQDVVKDQQVEPILGIYQKLISSKAQETHAFQLMETLILSISSDALRQYFGTILQLMLGRLSNSRTETLSNRFIRFFHLVSTQDDRGFGTDYFINVTDNIQKE